MSAAFAGSFALTVSFSISAPGGCVTVSRSVSRSIATSLASKGWSIAGSSAS
jgi:hypothetical protein